MDSGEGHIELMDRERMIELINNNLSEATKFFLVGEVVKVKDLRFRITKITTKKLTLRVLPER